MNDNKQILEEIAAGQKVIMWLILAGGLELTLLSIWIAHKIESLFAQ